MSLRFLQSGDCMRCEQNLSAGAAVENFQETSSIGRVNVYVNVQPRQVEGAISSVLPSSCTGSAAGASPARDGQPGGCPTHAMLPTLLTRGVVLKAARRCRDMAMGGKAKLPDDSLAASLEHATSTGKGDSWCPFLNCGANPLVYISVFWSLPAVPMKRFHQGMQTASLG